MPLGSSSLDLDVFEKVVLTLAKQVPTLETVVARNQTKFKDAVSDSLQGQSGSRSFFWRVFLGLVPESGANDTERLHEFL